MTCRKCKNSIDDNSNFCKHCGTVQREKCDECGQMELINLVDNSICEERLYTDFRNFYKKRSRVAEGLIISGIIIAFVGISIPVILPNNTILILTFLLGIIIAITGVSIAPGHYTKTNDKLRQKFIIKYPAYVKIIRLAKETEDIRNRIKL